jgi:hypothetical protein
MVIFILFNPDYWSVIRQMMGVIASEAKQSLHFKHEIATACYAGLAMTIPQIMYDEALGTVTYLCLVR